MTFFRFAAMLAVGLPMHGPAAVPASAAAHEIAALVRVAAAGRQTGASHRPAPRVEAASAAEWRLAQAPIPPSPAPAGPPAASVGQPSFEDRVANFVTEFYLSGETRSDEELERLYAASVEYFDNKRLTRERVLADKRAYFAKWPSRSYRLLRETLKVERRPGEGKIYDVSFEYEFSVASASRIARGRGRALLTMDLATDGGRITRETGVVLARW